MGTDDTVEVDIISVPRMNGDRWIVCSDGLYGQISKQELEEMAKISSLEEAAGKLLELALDHGGKDNISFILMEDILRSDDSSETIQAEDEKKSEDTKGVTAE